MSRAGKATILTWRHHLTGGPRAPMQHQKRSTFVAARANADAARHADGHGSAFVALHLAHRSGRSQAARFPRRRADAPVEADYNRHSLFLQVGDGCAGGKTGARRRAPASYPGRRRRADRHLWSVAHPDVADTAGPRRSVCRGRDECCPSAGDRSLRASAPSVVALSSRAQDRRPDAHPRARPQRH